MKKRPTNASPARSIADLFPESMRKFSYADLYGSCEAAGCARRARASCPDCGGEHCYAHAGHAEHSGRPPAPDQPS